MAVKLLVARHGQTQWNAENKVCGRTDQPLTEVGIQQAKNLAESVRAESVDMILSSPLERAHHMSRIVSQACGAPVLVDQRLIEQNYGIYEGVDRQNSGFLENKRHFAWKYPGGESMMQLAHRVYGLLDEIRENYDGKTVLLVCHGGVCRVIHTYFEDMTNEEYFRYSPDNASLMVYFL